MILVKNKQGFAIFSKTSANIPPEVINLWITAIKYDP